MRLAFTSSFTIAALVGTAAAQPSPDYPRAAVDRPLLLPWGGVEAGAALSLTWDSFENTLWETYVFSPRARSSLGSVELEAGAELLISDDYASGRDDRYRRVDVGARVRIADETAVGLELAALSIDHDRAAHDLAATLANQRKLGRSSAILLSIGPGVTAGVGGGAMARVEGEVRIMAQPTAHIAAHAYGRIAVQDLPDVESMVPSPTWDLRNAYGVGTTVSLSDDLDLVLGLDLANRSTITVGLVGRRLP